MRKITLFIVLLGYCFCGEDNKDKKLERQIMGVARRPNIGTCNVCIIVNLKLLTLLQNTQCTKSPRTDSVIKSYTYRPVGLKRLMVNLESLTK